MFAVRQCRRGMHWHVFFTMMSVSSTMYAKCKRRSATSTTSLPATNLVALVVGAQQSSTARAASSHQRMMMAHEDDLILSRALHTPRAFFSSPRSCSHCVFTSLGSSVGKRLSLTANSVLLHTNMLCRRFMCVSLSLSRMNGGRGGAPKNNRNDVVWMVKHYMFSVAIWKAFEKPLKWANLLETSRGFYIFKHFFSAFQLPSLIRTTWVQKVCVDVFACLVLLWNCTCKRVRLVQRNFLLRPTFTFILQSNENVWNVHGLSMNNRGIYKIEF